MRRLRVPGCSDHPPDNADPGMVLVTPVVLTWREALACPTCFRQHYRMESRPGDSGK
jgi:hypothetical protein